MLSAKDLLDSLMGVDRNSSDTKKKQAMGEQFLADEVCKLQLIGMCPKTLLSDTKRDMGKCKLAHAENFVEEFKAHPKREELTKKYERMLYAELKEIIGDAERWRDRE